VECFAGTHDFIGGRIAGFHDAAGIECVGDEGDTAERAFCAARLEGYGLAKLKYACHGVEPVALATGFPVVLNDPARI